MSKTIWKAIMRRSYFEILYSKTQPFAKSIQKPEELLQRKGFSTI